MLGFVFGGGGLGGIHHRGWERRRSEGATCRSGRRNPFRWRMSVLDASERQAEIEGKLEFWFSLPNLKRDWYLRSKMNKQGWVKGDLFLSFNSVKGLGVNVEEVLEAGSRIEGVEVNVEDKKLRAKISPEDLIRDLEDEKRRTVFITGMERGITHEDVKEIVADCGTVQYIGIGKARDRRPKGWVYVEFATEEEAQKCMEKVNGASESPAVADEATAADGEEEGAAEPVGMRAMMQEEFQRTQSAGRRFNAYGILLISGVPEGIAWNDLFDFVKSLGAVYLNYDVRGGDTECLARFAEPGKLLDMFERDEVSIGGQVLSARMLEGREEALYWSYAKETGSDWTESKEGLEAVDRILSSTVRPKRVAKANKPTVELSDLPSDCTWKTSWTWLQDQDMGVRFLALKREDDRATLFFSSDEKMAKFIDRIESGEGVMGSTQKMSYRVWTEEEQDEYWSLQREGRQEKKSGDATDEETSSTVTEDVEEGGDRSGVE